MDDNSTSSLLKEAEGWANFHRRHIFQIKKSIELLREADFLEPIIHSRDTINREKILSKLKLLKERERVNSLIGSFFSLNFLSLHKEILGRIKGLKADYPDCCSEYKTIFDDLSHGMEHLTSIASDILLETVFPEETLPRYLLLNVGTPSDLDDIDIAVIVDGKSEPFQHLISSWNTQMLRRIIPPHFYIAEKMESLHFTVSLTEIEDFLRKGGRQFVLISELLNGHVMSGSSTFFHQYRQGVLDQFLYTLDYQTDHFAYLKSMLSEARSLVAFRQSDFEIHFKQDSLRLIKAVLTAEKARLGIVGGTLWDSIPLIAKKNSRIKDIYAILQEKLSFIEIFRYLYFLLIAQSEGVSLDSEEAWQNLDKIADAMGYKKRLNVRAGQMLLLDYRNAVTEAREAVLQIVSIQRQYLRSLLLFSQASKKGPFWRVFQKASTNQAEEFINLLKGFSGTRFLSDILSILKTIDRRSLESFGKDYLQLPDRRDAIRECLTSLYKNPEVLITLLTICGRERDIKGIGEFFIDLLTAWLAVLGESQKARGRVIDAGFKDVVLWLGFMESLVGRGEQRMIIDMLSLSVSRENVIARRLHLISISTIIMESSRFFEKTIRRIARHSPRWILHLDDNDVLWQKAYELKKSAESETDGEKTILYAGRYYDIQFVRLGLLMKKGGRLDFFKNQFRRATDIYISLLCKGIYECMVKNGKWKAKNNIKNSICLLATGGNAREEGYDTDYDLIFLSGNVCEEMEMLSVFVNRFNMEFMKRGIMTHHRLSEKTGSFILTVDNLKSLFYKPYKDDFIEKSELLCCRFVYGNQAIYNKLSSEIIHPFIFEKKRDYVKNMIDEYKERQNSLPAIIDMDIKEAKGGIRDINHLLLIVRALYEKLEPLNHRLLIFLKNRENVELWQSIDDTYRFLTALRALYRIVGAFTDIIDQESLLNVSDALGYRDTDELINDFVKRTNRSHDAISSIILQIS